MRKIAFTLALSALLLLTGCVGRHIGKGMSRYEDGDYAAAMERFDVVAHSEADMNPKGHVRYLVYRGLTHYRVGQRPHALYYLARGRDAYSRGEPKWLKPAIVAEMNRALAELAAHPPVAPGHRPAPDVIVVPVPVAAPAP